MTVETAADWPNAEQLRRADLVVAFMGTGGIWNEDRLRDLRALLHRGAGFVALHSAVIAEKPHYLRGRDLEQMNELLRDGAREGGYSGRISALPSELAALRALLRRAKRGDVCAVMTHVERREIGEWLAANGYAPVPAERLQQLVAG